MIKTNSYESICLLFQGEEVSVEALQNALEIEPLSLLDVEFEKKVTWLKEKIASSDLVWRKKFD